MIVNDRHRFVFVHVPKTGGTSVARALSRLEGNAAAPLARTKHETAAEFLRRTRSSWRMTSPYRGYRFFAFVRNPWARFASLHRYLRAAHAERWPVPKTADDLAQALDGGAPWLLKLHSIRPQGAFLDDRTLVGRFERLGADFGTICRRLGIVATLPHLNATPPEDYRRVFSDASAEIIARIYADDVRRFGYSFDAAAEVEPASRAS